MTGRPTAADVTPAGTARRRPGHRSLRLASVLLLTLLALAGLGAASASAAPSPVVPTSAPAATSTPAGPTGPAAPSAPTVTSPSPTVSLTVGGSTGKPSQSITIILLLTALAAAPALLILCTSFTKIVVVLSLTRNALGLQNVPPNQVLAGLALFLSLFVMGPVLSAVNHDGLQPYLHGTKTQSQAWSDGTKPLRTWMLGQTRKDDLSMLTQVAHSQQVKAGQDVRPATPADVPLTTLVPAFVLSELKSAFIIGFVIFVPFLVIDLVVSSSLMSLGMMMVPPVLVSLPFKILLFVMVDGWALIVHSVVMSYR